MGGAGSNIVVGKGVCGGFKEGENGRLVESFASKEGGGEDLLLNKEQWLLSNNEGISETTLLLETSIGRGRASFRKSSDP